MAKHGRTDPDREWKLQYYEQLVADPQVKGLSWALAEAMREPDDAELNLSDQQCARRYLRTCILNASVGELGGMTFQDFAGWWARGILGASRYRSRRGRARAP